MSEEATEARPRNVHGFRTMEREKLLWVSIKGGESAKNRHKWTSEQAREAGRKGGAITARKKRERSEREKA